MPKSPVAQPLSEHRLLGNHNQHTPQEIAESAERGLKPTPRAYQIPLTRLKPWAIQPRQEMDPEGLRELAASIAVSGVLEPLVVRRDPDVLGGYLLVAGHRRLAAAQLVAGGEDTEARQRVTMLPCLVRDLDDEEAYALSLVENLQRKDLSARELLDAVLHLHQVYGWRKVRIARETGRNESYVGRLINVGQHSRLRPLVSSDRLSPTAAGHVLRLSRAAQDVLMSRIEDDGQVAISVADVLRFIDNEEARRDAFDDTPPRPYVHDALTRGAVIREVEQLTEDDSVISQSRRGAQIPRSEDVRLPSSPQEGAPKSVISQTEDDGPHLADAAREEAPPLPRIESRDPSPLEGRRVPVKEHTRLIAGSAPPTDDAVTGLARDILVFTQTYRSLTSGQRARLLPACTALVTLIGPDTGQG